MSQFLCLNKKILDSTGLVSLVDLGGYGLLKYRGLTK